jgi:hypothetical protein
VADNLTPLAGIITAGSTVWAVWATFFKNKSDATLTAFDKFQAIENSIREDFNVELVELRAELRMQGVQLREANNTIIELKEELKAAKKEAEDERKLRLKAEATATELVGRVSHLEGVLSALNIPINGDMAEEQLMHVEAMQRHSAALDADSISLNKEVDKREG